MKKILFSALLGAASLAAMAEGTSEAPAGYTLRWSDEFGGTALNEAIWNIEVNGSGGGNQELQYYRRENVSVGTDPATGDNCLILTARRENFGGKSFTSGRVTTQNKAAFSHGIIQARVKFPRTANGLWPAYWMMGNDMSRYGWPRCGEMDIVELGHANGIRNNTQDRYFGGTLHYGPNATAEGHQQYSQEYLAPESNPIGDDGYHIITVEWDDTNLYMYYDLESYTAAKKRQARYFTCDVTATDNELSVGKYFQKPYFFLFNLAVGGTYPSIFDAAGITALPGAGDEARMYVDWVRVYQKDDDANARYTYIDADGKTVTNIEAEPERPVDPDDKTELSSFATKALDENGESTFDFDGITEAVLISTSQGVTGHIAAVADKVYDYNVNDTNRNLWIWSNTYNSIDRKGMINSFGWEEGYNMFTVASAGWSGLGFNIANEDLSMIDGDYWLHFAMRGTDADVHTSHEMSVGKAKFIVGKSNGSLASVGDFKRDGEWYYFDIPVSALEQFYAPALGLGANFNDNIVSFISGGLTDAELCFDNIFFYKSSKKAVPTFTDSSTRLGKYGYKSLDDSGAPVFSFDRVTDIVPLYLSGDTWEDLTAAGAYGEGSLIKPEWDNSEQAGRNNFFVWGDPQTMKVVQTLDTPNSFGRVPYGGFPTYSSETDGITWNGAGWASIAGQGVNPTPKDLSMIDDEWYVHFSLRSDAAVSHIPVMVRFGSTDLDATLVFGSYSTKAVFADFKRDGEWYSFDIPVAELRKYGQLWSNAPANGGLTAYTDYALCIYTDQAFYNNSFFSIDNVFFYRTTDVPVVNELGDYATKSLDADGRSYFDFAGKHYISISANGSVTEHMKVDGEEDILLDLRDAVGFCKFYNWGDGNTYTEGHQSGTVPDSFGGDEGWLDLVTNGGWTGAGFINAQGQDFSELTLGNWHLHFAMRGTDACSHQIALGQAKFTIGFNAFAAGVPVLGNYRRDGEWYSFDIPLTELEALASEIFPASNGGIGAYKDNYLWFMSGGGVGDELQLDNVFLWRDKSSVSNAIDTITPADDNSNALLEIYNIAGRRVASMSAPGLYIVRRGTSVSKVLVR
ncbi:MAG: glycoside hydrolase family 16 protein [Muribaculaceae bacterium]|nr:glycoside hydrolase family 16 protein [Muribaculaceae bacterium]